MLDYDSLLRPIYPILFGGIGSRWLIHVQIDHGGGIWTTPATFTVLENGDNTMRLKLIDGVAADLKCGYVDITTDGILTIKKSKLVGIHADAVVLVDEIVKPIAVLENAKNLLKDTSIGSFFVKVLANELNGSLWKLNCEIEGGNWGYKTRNYMFIIIGHDGNTVRMRYLPFSDTDFFHVLDYFVPIVEATSPHVITVDFHSMLTFVHSADIYVSK